MQDPSELRRALAAHLDYYRELGIAGISRDPIWTARRTQAPPIERASVAPVAAIEDAGVAVAVPADEHIVETPASASAYQPGAESAAVVARALTAAAAAPPAESPIISAPSQAGASDDMPRARAPQTLLTELRTEIGPQCMRCKLSKLGRHQVVFGVGNPKAELMFVGEAPGRDEDIQGEPFVGRAGQLLTKIIEAINLTREDVYIANVIKCRPPENRNPEPDEIATCEPFLFRQIDAIKPKVIVALGTFAAQTLLKTDTPISRLRGQAHQYRGAQLVATFHPAYLLRSPDKKRDTWEDMKKVRALLRGEDA
jgi:uracil-DNA glycosylase